MIDVEHPDSISVIEHDLASRLADLGIAQLTTGVLRGDDRAVTVEIGSYLRQTQPTAAGVLFGSKHGGGWCVAVWLRDRPEAVRVVSATEISPDDPDLLLVARRFGLRVL